MILWVSLASPFPFLVSQCQRGRSVLLGTSWDLHGPGTNIFFYNLLRACVHLSLVVELVHLLTILMLCVETWSSDIIDD